VNTDVLQGYVTETTMRELLEFQAVLEQVRAGLIEPTVAEILAPLGERTRGLVRTYGDTVHNAVDAASAFTDSSAVYTDRMKAFSQATPEERRALQGPLAAAQAAYLSAERTQKARVFNSTTWCSRA
jgi:hypothetical protein